MIKEVFLPYNFDIFLNADYDVVESNGSWHTIKEQKDVYKVYGGYPSTYTYENTVFHQLWWGDDKIDYKELGYLLDMEVVSVSTIRQDPGCVIPIHRDEFYQIRSKFPERTELKVRANIFLQDWKLGHFLQYENVVASNWKQGQGYLWDRNVLHLSANAGMEPKYTLQISGFYNAK